MIAWLHVLCEIVVRYTHGWCVSQWCPESVQEREGDEENLDRWSEGGEDEGDGADDAARHSNRASAEFVN